MVLQDAVAFRRVDEVTPSFIVVDGVRLPREWVSSTLEPGQWLRFERRGDALEVRVDFEATLRAESRLNRLLMGLMA